MATPETDQALNKKDIENLTNIVESGFKRVLARQDLTNGKVLENTKWRNYITGGLAISSTVAVPITIYIIIQFIGKLINS